MILPMVFFQFLLFIIINIEEGCSVNPLPQNARSTMYTEKFSADLDLYQPIKMRDVADLYREYCYLREVEPVKYFLLTKKFFFNY